MNHNCISVVDNHWISLGTFNAATFLRQELAATSAAGALDVDSSGSDATAE